MNAEEFWVMVWGRFGEGWLGITAVQGEALQLFYNRWTEVWYNIKI